MELVAVMEPPVRDDVGALAEAPPTLGAAVGLLPSVHPPVLGER